jgi:hypothetical protein
LEGYIVDYSLLNQVKESGLEEHPTIIFNDFNQLISNCVPEQLKGFRRVHFAIIISGEWKQTHERLEDWETYVELTPDIMTKLLEVGPIHDFRHEGYTWSKCMSRVFGTLLDVIQDAVKPIGIFQWDTVDIERKQKARTGPSKVLQDHKIDPQCLEVERDLLIPREKGRTRCHW